MFQRCLQAEEHALRGDRRGIAAAAFGGAGDVRRTLAEMHEAISSARQLLDLSPRAARDELDRACQAAQRLRGRHPHTDELIIGLDRFSPNSSNPGDSRKYLEQLEAILAASGT